MLINKTVSDSYTHISQGVNTYSLGQVVINDGNAWFGRQSRLTGSNLSPGLPLVSYSTPCVIAVPHLLPKTCKLFTFKTRLVLNGPTCCGSYNKPLCTVNSYYIQYNYHCIYWSLVKGKVYTNSIDFFQG